MKIATYHQLSKVNTTFIKYNLLLGLENLGMADCNKYYVSFCNLRYFVLIVKQGNITAKIVFIVCLIRLTDENHAEYTSSALKIFGRLSYSLKAYFILRLQSCQFVCLLLCVEVQSRAKFYID